MMICRGAANLNYVPFAIRSTTLVTVVRFIERDSEHRWGAFPPITCPNNDTLLSVSRLPCGSWCDHSMVRRTGIEARSRTACVCRWTTEVFSLVFECASAK